MRRGLTPRFFTPAWLAHSLKRPCSCMSCQACQGTQITTLFLRLSSKPSRLQRAERETSATLQTSRVYRSRTPRVCLLRNCSRSLKKVVSFGADTTYSIPAPSPSFLCQQRSTPVDVQASGPTLASTPSHEDDRSPYLSTSYPVPTAKKTPLRRAAGAEQAIWRATRKPR